MKWECVSVRHSSRHNFVALWPTGKIDVQWLGSKFQGIKYEKNKIQQGVPVGEDWLTSRLQWNVKPLLLKFSKGSVRRNGSLSLRTNNQCTFGAHIPNSTKENLN